MNIKNWAKKLYKRACYLDNIHIVTCTYTVNMVSERETKQSYNRYNVLHL